MGNWWLIKFYLKASKNNPLQTLPNANFWLHHLIAIVLHSNQLIIRPHPIPIFNINLAHFLLFARTKIHAKYVVITTTQPIDVEGGMNLAPLNLDHKLILHQMPVCYHLPPSTLPHIQPLHPSITHGIQTQGRLTI